MKRLSACFYLGSYLGGILGVPILFIIGFFVWPLLILAIPLLIYSQVIYLIFVYKAWESIQDGHARTSPCQTIGLLYVPFFNFYWIFQAHWGFAKDYNAYISRHGVAAAPRLSEGLFLAFCIMSLIPFVNIVAPVLYAVIISDICHGVNSLPVLATVPPLSQVKSG